MQGHCTDGTGPFLRVTQSLEQTLETSDHRCPSWQTPRVLVPSPKWRWPVFQPLQRKEPAPPSLARSTALVEQFLRILTFWDDRGKRSPFQRRVMVFGQSVLGYCESATDGE